MTKIVIPEGQAQLEELLADSAQVKALMAGDQFGDVVKAYAKTFADNNAEIGQQVKEETQRVLAEYLRENEDAAGLKRLKEGGVEAVVKNAKDAAVYNPQAPGAKIDPKLFNGLRGFLTDIHHNTYRSSEVQERLQVVRNAFGSQEAAGGGFLVPEAFRAELLKLSLENGVVRPRARVVPMETSRVLYPTVDSTSHATNVFGGVQAYWTEESGTMTDVSATFGRIALEAWKLTAFANVPNELISDAALAFETFIRDTFPEALAYFEDDAFVDGNGVGQPLGFLRAPATVTVSKESGQAAATIVWENIVKMYSRMLPQSLNRAVWVVSPDTFPELATMALSVGTGGGPIWLNNGVAGPPATILGRPVIITEKVSPLGTAGDISFVDFGYYLIGDRQTLTVESSPHYRFQNGETSYKFVERVDGRPWIQSALTPRNSGPTLSPFVQLETRS